jgi:2-amino-4-hydroxy-6-hydroxymethyldihydropteridine diphosphokinase
VTQSVLIALGSNLGDRARNVRRAIHELRECMRIVRVSPMHETAPVDAPAGSPNFLNAVVAGYTSLTPTAVLECLHNIERRLGRRRGIRNAPRTIDLDLILYSARLMRSRRLTVPHPRYLGRDFVREPLRELRLAWRDPLTGVSL